jgi:hypothetical protein
VHHSKNRRLMNVLGHELPRYGQSGVSAFPPKAAPAVADRYVRSEPLSAARICSKNSKPLCYRTTVNGHGLAG